MPRSVFISYSRLQGDWVWDRLVPVLRAGDIHVLIDREQFEAARRLKRQMDEVQDRAELNLLILSPDYLASRYCTHEMKRGIARDPQFETGITIPIVRVLCKLPASIQRHDPLYVDLSDDRRADSWELLVRKLGADLGTTVPAWLEAREACRRFLQRKESVNLVVQGSIAWEPMIDGLMREATLQPIGRVDLENPSAVSRPGLVQLILEACGSVKPIPQEPEDLVELGRVLNSRQRPACLILTRFDHVGHRSYGVDLFTSLRYLTMESRKLVLLITSRRPLADLLPRDHPLSSFNIQTVELRARP
jgi:hypothetical protein